MKIAAILFILSVCYVASTEQAAAPRVHTHPNPKIWKEMQYNAHKMNAEAFPGAKAQFDLQQCANHECP